MWLDGVLACDLPAALDFDALPAECFWSSSESWALGAGLGLARAGLLLPAANFAAVVCLGCEVELAAWLAAAFCAALAAAAKPCANRSVLEACRFDDLELLDEAVAEGGRISSATGHHFTRPGAR